MKLRKVDPSLIKVPEVRVTAAFDPELYQQFQESIKAVGAITPPIVYEVEGELVLCDGLHRVQEALAAGEKLVNVVVIPGSMVDVLTKNIFLDHLRGKTPPSQMVKVIGALYEDYKLDPDMIRDKTGLSRDYIEKLISICQASPGVVEAIDKGVLGVNHAFQIARLPYPIQQEEVIAKHNVWRWTVKEITEQVDAVLREMAALKEAPPVQQSQGPEAPRLYACEGCREAAEPRYLRPVMLCPKCFGEVWRLVKLAQETQAPAEDETQGG